VVGVDVASMGACRLVVAMFLVLRGGAGDIAATWAGRVGFMMRAAVHDAAVSRADVGIRIEACNGLAELAMMSVLEVDARAEALG